MNDLDQWIYARAEEDFKAYRAAYLERYSDPGYHPDTGHYQWVVDRCQEIRGEICKFLLTVVQPFVV